MKQMNPDEMIDYLEGTLSEARRAQVEAYLENNPEDRELINIMRESMAVLHELDEKEPVRASDDFWIKVRNGLPAQPPRRSWTTQLGTWLWPVRRQVSVGFAVIAIALMATWFAPQQNQMPAVAGLSPEAEAFVQMSTQRHDAYVSSQPLNVNSAAVGDASSSETGDEDDDAGGSTP